MKKELLTMDNRFRNITVELMTLACLIQKPSNSYEISKFINAHTLFESTLSQNEVFTSLCYLCDMRYIECNRDSMNNIIKNEYIILSEGKEYYKRLLEDYNKRVLSVNNFLTCVSRF